MRDKRGFAYLWAVVCVAITCMAIGCTGDRVTAEIVTICEPGNKIDCTCDDGSAQKKTCLDHGLGYTDCPCEEDSVWTPDSDTSDKGSDTFENTDPDLGQTDSNLGESDSEDTSTDTDSAADSDTGTGVAGTDEEVKGPAVGEECDEQKPCAEGLDCFAGVCMDKLGSFQWGGEFDDRIDALAVDKQDAIYVAGIREEAKPGSSDPNDTRLQKIFLMKLDAAGSPLWTKELGGQSTRNVVADLAVDGQENIYLVGQTGESLDGKTDLGYRLGFMYIAKYNSAGERLWLTMSTMSSGNTRTNNASGVALDATDNPWVSGTIVNNKMFVAKFDKDSGEEVKVKELTATNTVSYGKDIAVDRSNGAIYLTGMDDRNSVLYKLNAEAEEIWREEWKSLNDRNDAPEALTLGPENDIYVVGTSEVEEVYDGACGISTCTDVFVTRIDTALGKVKWTTRLQQFPTVDFGLDIVAHPNGKLYITGGMFSDIVLIPFYPEASWHQVATTDAYAWPRLYLEDVGGHAPNQSFVGIGHPRDFLFDTTESPSSGIANGLYNKQGSTWQLVAAKNGEGGKGILHAGSLPPEPSLGAIFDFYYDDSALAIYEKAPYSRPELVHFASGKSPTALFDPSDSEEQGSALAVDSEGNILIAGQTYGNFMHGVNESESLNHTDSLLIKYRP